MRISPLRFGDQLFAAGTLFNCVAVTSTANTPLWPQRRADVRAGSFVSCPGRIQLVVLCHEAKFIPH